MNFSSGGIPKHELTVYYDGGCPLCSREIGHYRKYADPERVAFVDISESEFDAAEHGLDPTAIHRTMHARTADGEIVTGVDAFTSLWDTMPRYRRLGRVVRLPVVKQLAWMGYEMFRRVRPMLPRRSPDSSCDSGTCHR